MYAPLFHLRELPFRLSPDPEFLYLSREHARAKAYLESTIWFSDGFAVITGEIGSGKTTLIETFLRELQKDVICAQISQTQVSETEFLQSLLVQFGFQPFHMNKVELIAAINGFLIEQYSNGRRVLLIVDEAQNLTPKVLEEIRLLSGVETTKKVLRIVLAGQPELNEKLNSPELAQLVQRIRLRFHLTALPAAELGYYIEHRLDVAGSKGRQIFDPASYPLIFQYTGGTPRLINVLCDTAMMSAFGAHRDVVTVDDVQRSIAELQWSEHPAVKAASKTPATPSPTIEETRKQQHVVGRLLVAFSGKTQSQHELVLGRLGIGRTRDNDLRIKSRHISRHHAQIINEPEGSVLEDLNSTNGVYIRSKRIRRRLLNNGDVIQIGQHELIYIDDRKGAMGESAVGAEDEQAQEHISTLVASEFPDQPLRWRK